MLTTAEVQTHAADPTLAAALSAGDDVSAAARLSQLLTETAPVPTPASPPPAPVTPTPAGVMLWSA